MSLESINHNKCCQEDRMRDSVGVCKCRYDPLAVLSQVFDGNVHFEFSKSPQKWLKEITLCMYVFDVV